MYLSFIIIEPYKINIVPSEGHYTTTFYYNQKLLILVNLRQA